MKTKKYSSDLVSLLILTYFMIICQTIHFMNKYFKFNIGIDLENFNLQKVAKLIDYKTDLQNYWKSSKLNENTYLQLHCNFAYKRLFFHKISRHLLVQRNCGDMKTTCRISTKLTLKAPVQCQWLWTNKYDLENLSETLYEKSKCL